MVEENTKTKKKREPVGPDNKGIISHRIMFARLAKHAEKGPVDRETALMIANTSFVEGVSNRQQEEYFTRIKEYCRSTDTVLDQLQRDDSEVEVKTETHEDVSQDFGDIGLDADDSKSLPIDHIRQEMADYLETLQEITKQNADAPWFPLRICMWFSRSKEHLYVVTGKLVSPECRVQYELMGTPTDVNFGDLKGDSNARVKTFLDAPNHLFHCDANGQKVRVGKDYYLPSGDKVTFWCVALKLVEGKAHVRYWIYRHGFGGMRRAKIAAVAAENKIKIIQRVTTDLGKAQSSEFLQQKQLATNGGAPRSGPKSPQSR
jgi:hypothetical protein